MSTARFGAAAAAGLIGALLASQADAQSAGADAEIAVLKQQLQMMEQSLDRLQQQTSANTAAAAWPKPMPRWTPELRLRPPMPHIP